MTTSNVKYLGNLRTEAVHNRSGSQILTDAPIDNKGRGEAFSPTDLTATSLAACMITVMGIKAMEDGIPFEKVSADVSKIMTGSPRKISEIHIKIYVSAKDLSSKQRTILERTGRTCPVALSLHPEIKQVIEFVYLD